MKRTILTAIAALILTSGAAFAKSVSPSDAMRAARNHIVALYDRNADCQLTLTHTAVAANGITSYYIFNVDNNAFVIATADDRCVPVIAYSPNGLFDPADVPPAVQMWLDWMRQDLSVIIEKNLWDNNYWDVAGAQEQWAALLDDDLKYYDQLKSKAYTDSLMTTKWGQGQGYNDLCPEYNGSSSSGAESSGGHAVVGCVSTALSQIIRYHEYPARGFGYFQYNEASYGTLSVSYDSATYLYSQMPNTVTSTTRTQISRLCYHVSVLSQMHFAGRNYTGGSGAHLSDAAKGLAHMGYFRAKFKQIGADSSTTAGWDKWKSWMRREITNRRPVLYAGYNQAYTEGHAYVIDGFKMNSTYGLVWHINWGWNGNSNGHYWVMSGVSTPLGGYGFRQECVYNIEPSYLANTVNGPQRYYISSSATSGRNNDGSTWAKGNPNLSDAIQACGMYDAGEIWVKKGFYYGDTNVWLGVTSAFNTLENQSLRNGDGVKIYGGFIGSETNLDDRNPKQNSTYLDGSSKLRVFYGYKNTSPVTLDGFTIRNGRISSGYGAGAYLKGSSTLANCTVANCTGSTSGGAGVYLEDSYMLNSKINNVTGGSALYSKGGSATNCIIANNDGKGVQCSNGGSFTNCNIVSNNGAGITLASGTTVTNCIIWNNTTQTSGSGTISYSAVMGSAPSGTGNVALANGNMDATGPHFVQPATTQGIDYSEADWQLADAQSPCYNAGDPNDANLPATDLAGNDRVRHGRVDIGCYEFKNLGIGNAKPVVLSTYPNPANDMIHIDGVNGDVTLYDMTGKTLMRTSSVNGAATMSLSTLPAGVYYLKAGHASTKIVKK
ncbi:MAG: C10 family peptidase [Bacteroidales bacterium]|nr:C10 family peptidase [Bacteroidales bacterium]